MRCCNACGTSPNTTHSNHLKKQDKNFSSLVVIIFLWIWCFIIWFFTCLMFWLRLLIAVIQGGQVTRWTSHKVDLLTITPRKTSAENSWIIILQNNYKCLLLNDKKMLHEILLSLFDEMQNTKKMKTWELKERTFK